MKTFRSIGLAIIAIILSIGFVSCGDDESNEDITNTFSIVGSWEECDSEGIPMTIEQFHYVFNRDGSGKWYTTGSLDEDGSSSFTYKFTEGEPTGVLEVTIKGEGKLTGYTTYNNGILKIAWVGGDTILLRRSIN